jgi:hypothetical protein
MARQINSKKSEAEKRKLANAARKKEKEANDAKKAAEAKSKTAEGIKERGFKSVKTKRDERKEGFKKDRKDARQAIRDEDRGSDARKQKRYEARNVAREQQEQRQADRKSSWAEKQVLKGKFKNTDQANERYDAMRDMRTKSRRTADEIISSTVGQTQNELDAEQEVQDETAKLDSVYNNPYLTDLSVE